jgi:DUF1365 family protein
MALSLAPLFHRMRTAIVKAPLQRSLLDARVVHARFEPKPYALRHRLTYLYVPMAALSVGLQRPLLSRNRFNLFSLNDRDYGSSGTPCETWINEVFASAGLDLRAAHTVSLLTLPRVLGFGFNPVSFWFYRDEAGALRAVLAEVNNTFGERHCYLCRKPDGTAIARGDEVIAEKALFVSPFLPVAGHYVFRFSETEDRLSVHINLIQAGRRVMTASIVGRLGPLSSAALARSFARHLIPGLKVLFLIHIHALGLYLSGARILKKPKPPPNLVSHSGPSAPQEPALE